MMMAGQKIRIVAAMLLSTALLTGIGCKKTQSAPEPPATAVGARTDQQIANDVQAKLNGETALNGQKIDLVVEGGRATLSGSVTDDASRALAANDAGSVDGIKTVVNNLTVAPARQAEVAAPPPPMMKERKKPEPRQKMAPPPQEMQQEAQAPPPPPEPVRTVAPPPPARPVVKTVTLPAGTVIPVRMIDTLDSASTQPNSTFRGTLAGDLIAEGMLVAPRGASITGQVTEAKDATHFTGSSQLSIQLTQLSTGGQRIQLVTDPYTKQGKARGKNTAVKTGAGAAIGGLIGALAGGGKGAAIGAATGGGVGAGVNGVTRGEQVQIPSESIVNFRLQAPISVTTSTRLNQPRSYSNDQDPSLQQRQ